MTFSMVVGKFILIHDLEEIDGHRLQRYYKRNNHILTIWIMCDSFRHNTLPVGKK